MNKVKAIERLNEREMRLGLTGSQSGSWHDEFKESPYIYVGGLDYELTEGDVVAVFSQYGEIIAVNLVRDKSTGKSKGFAFLAYADQRSTVLAVDNFNGIKILGRTLKVDHVKNYKKKNDEDDSDTLVPRPDLSQQTNQQQSSSTTTTKKKEEEKDEKDVEIDEELRRVEEKLRKVERRLLKCDKHAKEGKMTKEEAERERNHLNRVSTKLLHEQEVLWDSIDKRKSTQSHPPHP